ncbi:hypothetical protein K9N68_37265 (plasmid) [Kovacikia minuta CCNUW1]|uniref:hypothetical protein n=1 Tax=Kovacikia minuta TaxID=2931930 RepID=UPI001CCBAC25|nr:hypothetical protein [Kovacikia minuta]UBF29863.1 hypothetical protein K9N68_37265 [Kovacikia minuta CCNUW1]
MSQSDFLKSLTNQATKGFLRATPQDRSEALRFWQSSANADKNYGHPDIEGLNIPQRLSYWGGRIAGDVSQDLTRGAYWRYNHPLAITQSLGSQIPKAARFIDETGKVPTYAKALSGLGLVTAMDVASGNVDLTNLQDWGRPRGYSAIFASPEDATKSEAPLLEPLAGYVVGRKGKLLPWEEFHQERPDVSPEQYQKYKEYQGFNKPGLFGLEQINPVFTGITGAVAGVYTTKPGQSGRAYARRAAIGALVGASVPKASELVSSMGLIKGTSSNLQGEPEAQLMGYKVPLSAALITGGVGAGIYAYLRNRAERSPFAQEEIPDPVEWKKKLEQVRQSRIARGLSVR